MATTGNRKFSVSRRKLLAGMGAGAGVFALRPVEAMASVITDAAGGLATSPDRFGRIFNLAPFADFNASTLRPARPADVKVFARAGEVCQLVERVDRR